MSSSTSVTPRARRMWTRSAVMSRSRTCTSGTSKAGDHYSMESTFTSINIARPGGAVGRVGVPQDERMPASQTAFYSNLTVSGGPAPARAYIEELLPDILEGRIEPGRVLDRTVPLDEVPDGYRAMDEREAIKVMVEP